MQSSNSYVAGDSCAVNYNPTGEKVRISLATNAVRLERLLKYMGTEGTSSLRIFDIKMASARLKEASATAVGKR